MSFDNQLDLTSFAASLKSLYIPLKVKNLAYKKRPFHAILPKMETFTGANLPLPNVYENPQGNSSTFATAQANKVSSQLSKFTITRFHDYSLANIDNETMEASVGDAGAFMEAATTEIDGAFNSSSKRIASDEFHSGTGSIGTIGTLASTLITLSDPESVVNFAVGQTIQTSSGDGTGLRTGSAQITNIDRNLGTLTCSTTWSAGIAAIAQGDFILNAGDFNGKFPGLDGWLPMPGTLTSTAFFGVDRTQDATRLGGVSLTKIGAPIEDVLTDLGARIAREGGEPDTAVLNYTNYAALEKALGSKVQYVTAKASDADIGFQAMRVITPSGEVKVMADMNMFSNRVYMLTMDTWKLYSLGSAPKILNSDGLKFLRLSSADGVELRIGRYAVLGCTAPGWNGVAQIS